MPITMTFVTGDTVTLSEDGIWSGDPTLVKLGELTDLAPADRYKTDYVLELARTLMRETPGFIKIEEIDRPPIEPLPEGAIP
ncbi:MAG: hypothetical protein ACO1Q7_04055 [Gemmatimonas sp.]